LSLSSPQRSPHNLILWHPYIFPSLLRFFRDFAQRKQVSWCDRPFSTSSFFLGQTSHSPGGFLFQLVCDLGSNQKIFYSSWKPTLTKYIPFLVFAPPSPEVILLPNAPAASVPRSLPSLFPPSPSFTSYQASFRAFSSSQARQGSL